jgi:nitrilase
MSATLPVAAVQMVSTATVASNLQAAAGLIARAAADGARLVVLPEFFPILGRRDTDKVDARERFGDGPIQSFLAHAARAHGVWLVGGTVPLAGDEPRRIRNACLAFRPDGSVAARYDKVHLFSLQRGEERFDESATIAPGRTPVLFDLDDGGRRWRIGLSVCYDLRFPELYRAMGEVDIILVPAAFTATTGRAHFETLVRARAIENLAYVIAPAQGGYHVSGRETHGDSMIVDPWGNVLDRLPRGSGVVIAGVNRAYQESLRKSLPALKHRKLDCSYGIEVDVIKP